MEEGHQEKLVEDSIDHGLGSSSPILIILGGIDERR